MFLSPETTKSLEGKYLKFQDGVTRVLKLVSHKAEAREGNFGPYTANVINVVDVEVNEDKEFTADRGFMNKLSGLNNKLQVGSVLTITPTMKTVMGRNGAKEVFDYQISLGDNGLDSVKL